MALRVTAPWRNDCTSLPGLSRGSVETLVIPYGLHCMMRELAWHGRLYTCAH